MFDTQQLAGCANNIGLVNGDRRQPDGMSEANLRQPHQSHGRVKNIEKLKFYEFCRKIIDIRKIIFILAETTWDIVPKHY